MKVIFKRLLKYLFLSLKGLVLFLCFYFAAYYICSNIVVNSHTNEEADMEIFIASNGVHTDLIFPVRTAHIAWDTLFKPETFKRVDSSYQYVALGWGDKGFYIETPTWADLKASTAFKACFFLSSSAMHVCYHKNVKPSSHIKSIKITSAQYQKLINFYQSTLLRKDQSIQLIKDKGYTPYDNFYEAKGTYSFLKTCNVFTNDALKYAKVKAPYWSPFEGGLMKHY
jgi:uncharacterized protein (TIGR02117 family)